MSIGGGLILIGIGVAYSTAVLGVENHRIWLEARINGKPVRLCFDTGSSSSSLCPGAAQKLGLKFNPASTNDFSPGFLAGLTEEFTLSLEGAKWKTSFPVLDLPEYVRADFDGIIGWFTLRWNVMRIDAGASEVVFLAKVPAQTARWSRLSVFTNFNTLDLEVPHGDRTNGIVRVDTGYDGGLVLPAQEWNRWREAHPQRPITLRTIFSQADGFGVFEEAWADQITVGPMVLTGVPIAHNGRASATRLGERYEGTLGLAALKRVDFVVDGNNNMAYLRAKTTHPPPYTHNRLGAVFVPTGAQTNQAVAWVVEHGPAYDAGVRNGDVLLQVDEVLVTSWSDRWLSRFCMPAGTKLKLTLKRAGKTLKTTATLRQILQPSPNKNH
jgi:hypothetical protein